MEHKRALFLGAHTDDVEIGCGGYLQRFKDKKIVAFSAATESIPNQFSKDSTINEFYESVDYKICCDSCLYDVDVRRFDEDRQFILDRLIQIKNEYKPEIVFVHQIGDYHQDHKVLTEEAIRAFKDITIIGYGLYIINANLFINLSQIEIDNKVDYVSTYKSQLAKRDFIKIIRASAEYWGGLFKKQYIEPYNVIQQII